MAPGARGRGGAGPAGHGGGVPPPSCGGLEAGAAKPQVSELTGGFSAPAGVAEGGIEELR